MASGWMTVWRLDAGELKDSKDAVKMVEATVQLGGRYHQGKRRNANRGVEKEAYEIKGNVWRREYFRSDNVDETTPHLGIVILCR